MSKSPKNIAAASLNEHTRKQSTAPTQKEMLCVVTSQTKSGKSIIARQGAMKPLTVGLIPGVEFYRIWGSDTSVELPCDGTPPTQQQYFPPKNGFRFGMFSLPSGHKYENPDSQQAPTSAQLEEMEQKLPGLMKLFEADHPGMHTSDSVDFDVVVFGEVVLELDDGAEIVLKAGDCVIQNGTRHAWHNRSSQRCLVAFSLVGAQRERTT